MIKRGMRKFFTHDDEVRIEEMMNQGYGTRYICNKIGCSASSINYRRKIGGRVSRSHRPWMEEDEKELVRLWNSGLTSIEIGKRLDRCKNSVDTKVFQLRQVGVHLMDARQKSKLKKAI